MQILSNAQIYLIAFAVLFFATVLGLFIRRSIQKYTSIQSKAEKKPNLTNAKQGSLLVEDAKVTPISQELIIFNICAPKGTTFNSDQLITLLKNLGGKLVEGFFVFADTGGNELFRVANAKKPGVLEVDIKTDVIVCATDLNKAFNPVETFDALLDAANTLTSKLDGVLCDSGRSPMSKQMMIHLRSKAQNLSIDRKLSSNL
ncbi:MAG: cell division protein ZipA C-terminal FtsZ-binding domain-containing protein [Gammaproteobacteria bacterium]